MGTHGDAVDDAVAAERRLDGVLHLGGGHVLALPLVGVAGAVAEVQVAELVRHQDVAAHEGRVARAEHVAHQLLVAVRLRSTTDVNGNNLTDYQYEQLIFFFFIPHVTG